MSPKVLYSKDGTKIPMIITHKKGLKLDGTNPTMLYGYRIQREFNKFQHSQCRLDGKRRRYGTQLTWWWRIRKKWHDAGTKMQKQNVFDDFIAAAEYLIAQNTPLHNT
jgi:prolyl oligopeptidase